MGELVPYAAGRAAVWHGDCLDILAALPDASVDSIVTDPPYGLEFMGKEWDGSNGFRRTLNRNDVGRDNAFGRTSRTSPEYRAGALFQEWATVWARECLRVLKPGGHLVAFGGTRTFHRLAVAMEDAGFEIRDSIAWLYGSGFPKSMDVSKAIDKTGGVNPQDQAAVLMRARERSGMTREQVAEAVGCSAASVQTWEQGRSRAAGLAPEFITPSTAYREKLADLLGFTTDERRVVGATVDRRGDATVIGLGHSGVKYDGPATDAARTWQGWGTALKPAFEPIVVGRKPLIGTVAANVLAHGTGALNVDGCRVAHASEADLAESVGKNRHADFGSGPRENQVFGADHRDRGESGNYDGSQGRWPANVVLDEAQAAELDQQSGTSKGRKTKPRAAAEPGEGWRMTATGTEHDDIGGASRFFYVAKAPAKERPTYLRFDCYCEGPAVVTVPGVRREGETCPECGAGTRKVAHPTVKPLTFMRWLARLVTPPNGLLVDTFGGTGTTAEAALLEGFRVLLVEQDGEHIPLIADRLSKYETPEEASA